MVGAAEKDLVCFAVLTSLTHFHCSLLVPQLHPSSTADLASLPYGVVNITSHPRSNACHPSVRLLVAFALHVEALSSAAAEKSLHAVEGSMLQKVQQCVKATGSGMGLQKQLEVLGTHGQSC